MSIFIKEGGAGLGLNFNEQPNLGDRLEFSSGIQIESSTDGEIVIYEKTMTWFYRKVMVVQELHIPKFRLNINSNKKVLIEGGDEGIICFKVVKGKTVDYSFDDLNYRFSSKSLIQEGKLPFSIEFFNPLNEIVEVEMIIGIVDNTIPNSTIV